MIQVAPQILVDEEIVVFPRVFQSGKREWIKVKFYHEGHPGARKKTFRRNVL
jgi:hypothetical protein